VLMKIVESEGLESNRSSDLVVIRERGERDAEREWAVVLCESRLSLHEINSKERRKDQHRKRLRRTQRSPTPTPTVTLICHLSPLL
jgi:hypothetical protein